MNNVKPIETKYNGYRFRSRLEARWAVFFSTAQISYEYELEGFSLPSGTAYLPDFYLPEFDVYVEIKPSLRITLPELKKLCEFAFEGDKNLLLIVGTPTQEDMLLIQDVWNLDEIAADFGVEGRDEDVVDIFLNMLREHSSVTFGGTPLNKMKGWQLVYRNGGKYPLINYALSQAKEARFEFGESGNHK